MTVREAAQQLELSTSEIYALCRARLLRHCRFGKGRGRIRIEPSDLALYRASCVVEPLEPGQTQPKRPRYRQQAGRPLLLPLDVLAARKVLNKSS